jgi:hypothetical protein
LGQRAIRPLKTKLERVLIGVALLVATFIPARCSAKDSCDDAQDITQVERCFIRQFPCENAYFGIDRRPDYERALSCFETERSWPFIILMRFNGEGAPRDLAKAEATLTAWKREDPGTFNDEQAAPLRKAIDECKPSNKKTCPRVDYCKELAMSTFYMEICDGVDQISAEAALSRTIAGIRSTLSASDRASFDRVITTFKAYELLEMTRGYDAAADASLRVLAGSGQAAFARDDFLKLVAATLMAHNLKAVTTIEYATADHDLSRVFNGDIGETISSWQQVLNDPQAHDRWHESKSYIADYRKSARESQLQWIKFRDSCAELASSLYRNQAGMDPAVSMKAAVTQIRIKELRYNPIGPEDK